MTQYGGAETNTYTGDGLRARKSFPYGGGTASVYYVYDGDEPVAEVNASGAGTAAHTFGPNGLVSRLTPGLDTFYTYDPQGSVAQQTDSGGNVAVSSLHDAFGNWVSTGGGDSVFGFGGQWGYYTDAQTGLRLCGHRFYDNTTGRWLTRDPMGYGGGVNLYGYCLNNPVNGIDPSGYIILSGPPIHDQTPIGFGKCIDWDVFWDCMESRGGGVMDECKKKLLSDPEGSARILVDCQAKFPHGPTEAVLLCCAASLAKRCLGPGLRGTANTLICMRQSIVNCQPPPHPVTPAEPITLRDLFPDKYPKKKLSPFSCPIFANPIWEAAPL